MDFWSPILITRCIGIVSILRRHSGWKVKIFPKRILTYRHHTFLVFSSQFTHLHFDHSHNFKKMFSKKRNHITEWKINRNLASNLWLSSLIVLHKVWINHDPYLTWLKHKEFVRVIRLASKCYRIDENPGTVDFATQKSEHMGAVWTGRPSYAKYFESISLSSIYKMFNVQTSDYSQFFDIYLLSYLWFFTLTRLYDKYFRFVKQFLGKNQFLNCCDFNWHTIRTIN